MVKNPMLDSKKNENLDQESSIRPQKLTDFIGQTKIKNNLQIFIEASKQRKESLDHCLFYGPPGLGKTTLSQIIATEMGAKIKFTSGPAISKSGDLAAIISSLSFGDVLFIDEIHRLPIAVEEILYSAMEDFKLDFVVGEGSTARSLRIDIPKFTLIGATTRYGLLSSPLRDRFGITLQLEFYSVEDLVSILKRTASILEIPMTKDATIEIAKRSRGTPRIANRILKRLRDFLAVSNKSLLDLDLTNESLLSLGIDAIGLDDLDKKYLECIAKFYNGGPVGIDSISATLSEAKDTIEDTVEPFLLQLGFIARTSRGRTLTKLAFEHLGYDINNIVNPNLFD